MKIVFLNIWGGKMYEPLLAFLREQASATDVFCFQEVFDSPAAGRTVRWGGRADIFSDLKAALPEFTPYYAVSARNYDGDEYTDFDLSHGNAIFARKRISVSSSGDFFISDEGMPSPDRPHAFPHKLQYVRLESNGAEYIAANVHGVAYPGSKRDTPERIKQSQKIVEFLNGERGEKILGGDFNLLPDTESIRMIERAGMRNLVKEYGITTTRTMLSYGQYPESDRQYFADYAFVSTGVQVKDFTVPQIEVSDHLPLILEFA